MDQGFQNRVDTLLEGSMMLVYEEDGEITELKMTRKGAELMTYVEPEIEPQGGDPPLAVRRSTAGIQSWPISPGE